MFKSVWESRDLKDLVPQVQCFHVQVTIYSVNHGTVNLFAFIYQWQFITVSFVFMYNIHNILKDMYSTDIYFHVIVNMVHAVRLNV